MAPFSTLIYRHVSVHAALFLLFSMSATAGTINVTTTMDVVGGAGTSLREAFDMANTDGMNTDIVLQSGALYQLTLCGSDEDANVDGDLDHTAMHDLTIIGNGATIEQICAGERVIHNLLEDATITIEDVTITGGDRSDGAGVRSLGNVVLDQANITGNTTGGGVLAGLSDGLIAGAVLTVMDSTVTMNAPFGLRGIEGSIDVDGSMLDANDGAGIVANFAFLTMTNSSANGNTGRGIAGIDANVDLTNTDVLDNGSHGVDTTFGEVAIAGSTISDNGESGFECSGCTAIDFTNTTFDGNMERGIHIEAIGTLEPSMTINVTDCMITNNRATGHGVGIAIFEDESPQFVVLNVLDSTISGNENTAMAVFDGGGIYSQTGEMNINGTTISNNVVDGSGGGIAVDGVILQIASDTTISENMALNTGGGIDQDGGELHVSHSTIADNGAGQGGGFFVDGATPVRIQLTTVSGNMSVGPGAGYWGRDGETRQSVHFLRKRRWRRGWRDLVHREPPRFGAARRPGVYDLRKHR